MLWRSKGAPEGIIDLGRGEGESWERGTLAIFCWRAACDELSFE